MHGIQVMMFLVSCAESLLVCVDLSVEDLYYATMGDCRAEVPAVTRETSAREPPDAIVMARCRYQLVNDSDLRHPVPHWVNAKISLVR